MHRVMLHSSRPYLIALLLLFTLFSDCCSKSLVPVDYNVKSSNQSEWSDDVEWDGSNDLESVLSAEISDAETARQQNAKMNRREVASVRGESRCCC